MDEKTKKKINAFYNTPIKEVMSKDFITMECKESMDQLLEELERKDVDHVWITEEGKLKGIVTEKDVIRALKASPLEDELALNVLEIKSLVYRRESCAENIMTKRLFQSSPDTNLRKIIRIMNKDKISHMPVIDDDKKMIGEIVVDDLIRCFRNKLSGEL